MVWGYDGEVHDNGTRDYDDYRPGAKSLIIYAD